MPCVVRVAGRAAQYILFAILLLASVSKLLSMDSFVTEISRWSVIDERIAPAVAFVVVTVELGLPLAWLVAGRPAALHLAAVGLIFAFTLAYLFESWIAEPPNCACFGKVLAFAQHEASIHAVVWRNAALLALGVFGWVSSPGRSKVAPSRSSGRGELAEPSRA